MWDYSETVKEYYTNPKNVGSIEDADAIGEAGALACGDALKLYLKIKDGIITDAKFQTFGCGSAVASSSMLTEMIIGKSLDEVKKITNKDIIEKLGGLPPEKTHCSVMGREALEDALNNYYGYKIGEKSTDKIICNCFSVTENVIKEAVEQGAKTIKEITDLTYAGGACGRCKENIQKIIDSILGPKKINKEELTPVQFALKVNSILEKEIAPQLALDNGGLELVDIEGKNIYIKLKGTCESCPNAKSTVKNFIEKKLKELIDDEINVIEG